MKVIQCENGHFYDLDRYDECPMCKKMKEVGTQNKEKIKTAKLKPIDVINKVDVSNLEDCKDATIISESEKKDAKINRPNDDEKTIVNFNDFMKQSNKEKTKVNRPSDDAKTIVSFDDYIDKTKEDVQEPKEVKEKQPLYNGPVVGWLVATTGVYRGQSFELYAKKNFIGRSEDMIVNLSLDKTVSRTSPIAVIFNKQKNTFVASPGVSDQTVYINNDLVIQPVELHRYDKIVVGNTTLLFFPFVSFEKGLEEIYGLGKK